MKFALVNTHIDTVAGFSTDKREGLDVMLLGFGIVVLPDAPHVAFEIRNKKICQKRLKQWGILAKKQ